MHLEWWMPMFIFQMNEMCAMCMHGCITCGSKNTEFRIDNINFELHLCMRLWRQRWDTICITYVSRSKNNNIIRNSIPYCFCTFFCVHGLRIWMFLFLWYRILRTRSEEKKANDRERERRKEERSKETLCSMLLFKIQIKFVLNLCKRMARVYNCGDSEIACHWNDFIGSFFG